MQRDRLAAFVESVPALSEMYRLATSGPYAVDDKGRMLWLSLDHAMTYAQVRALVHKSRQQVVPVTHLGVRTWWVRKAEAKVSEPCS